MGMNRTHELAEKITQEPGLAEFLSLQNASAVVISTRWGRPGTPPLNRVLGSYKTYAGAKAQSGVRPGDFLLHAGSQNSVRFWDGTKWGKKFPLEVFGK